MQRQLRTTLVIAVESEDRGTFGIPLPPQLVRPLEAPLEAAWGQPEAAVRVFDEAVLVEQLLTFVGSY